jgi:ADP-ribose pyrophosphatase YjhB (NUDIX family)
MGRFPFEVFKDIFSKVPRVTVEVVLIKDGGIVLSLRNIEPYKGYWHTPGGTLFHKEKVEDAVKRVAKEELGVSVEVDKFLGYWEIPEWTQPKGFSHAIGLVFQVKTLSEELKPDTQSSEIKVFKKLPKNMVREQKEFLERMKF